MNQDQKGKIDASVVTGTVVGKSHETPYLYYPGSLDRKSKQFPENKTN